MNFYSNHKTLNSKLKLAACSFSGGKDSTLALFEALRDGYDVKYLVNFISRKYKRSSFHGIKAELIQVQAKCVGIPLLQYTVGRTNNSYERTFLKMLKKLKNLGIKYFICGDIYLEEHPNWIKKQCKKVGLKLIEPLWKKDTEEILRKFVKLGFKAIVVSINAKILPKKLVGEELNEKFLSEIKKYKVCKCGENGEYHTFVYDGPIFKQSIKILYAKKFFKKTYWSSWFLDIKKYKVVEKHE